MHFMCQLLSVLFLVGFFLWKTNQHCYPFIIMYLIDFKTGIVNWFYICMFMFIFFALNYFVLNIINEHGKVILKKRQQWLSLYAYVNSLKSSTYQDQVWYRIMNNKIIK